jgi:MreB/Mbl protein
MMPPVREAASWIFGPRVLRCESFAIRVVESGGKSKGRVALHRGTSLLRNLDRLITQEIGISCYVADNPLECVAMGAGIALDHLELIKRSMPAEGEWLVSF